MSELRGLIEAHLRAAGWYQDLECGMDPDYAWTIPEWENYWKKPYTDGPYERRYVTFDRAIAEQIDREDGKDLEFFEDTRGRVSSAS